MKRYAQKILSIIVSITMISSSIMAKTPPEHENKVKQHTIHISLPKGAKEKIDKGLALLDNIEKMIPDRYSHIDKFVGLFDEEPQPLIEEITNNISYLPYIGVLRGPDGTLTTGAGNSWDQALLLAAALNSMDMEAQIVTGTLSKKDTSRLINEAFSSTKRENMMPKTEILLHTAATYDKALAEKLKQSLTSAVDNVPSSLLSDTIKIKEKLLSLLKEHTLFSKRYQDIDKLTDEVMKDYAWVQWRESEDEPWHDVHPAFGMQSPPQITPEEIVTDQVPKEHLHQISLQLMIERSNAKGELETIPVMDEYIRPSAQFFKKQIPIGFVQGKEGSNFLVPLLHGELAPGAVAVASTGLTADPAIVYSPEGFGAGELIATSSNKMAHSIGILGALDIGTKKKHTPMRLTGILLQTKIVTPNEPVKTTLRRILDFRGKKEMVDLAKASVEAVIDVDIGKQATSVVTRKHIEASKKFIESLPWIFALAKGDLKLEELSHISNFPGFPPVSWVDFDLYSTLFIPQRNKQRVTFRPGVFLVARYILPGKGPKRISVSDFIDNPCTVITKNPNGVLSVDRYAVLEQGARDTLIESMLMNQKKGWSTRIPKYLVTSSEVFKKQIEKKGWSQQAKDLAKQHLKEGYILALIDTPEPYWWRVNPHTCEILGMGEYGGTEATENVLLKKITFFITGALSVAALIPSIQSCDKVFANNSAMRICCKVGNVALSGGSAFIGGAANGIKLGGLGLGVAEAEWLAAIGTISSSLNGEMVGYIIGGSLINSGCEKIMN